MSNVASSGDLLALPEGVGGSAAVEFGPLVKAFARTFGQRRGAGAGLVVRRHGETLVDIATGSAAGKPWTEDTGAIIFSATKGIAATVIHRLADRGLIDYHAPVAEYWPEFAANGKGSITVAQVLTHSAGLSGISNLATQATEVLDHQLMEQRLAAAKPDHLLGFPAYHALTLGWLLAGLARAVTGQSMATLFRTEVAEPLGTDGIHLGRPPAAAPTTYAPLAGNQLKMLGRPLGALILGRSYGFPGAAGAAARALFMPGMEGILEGEFPPILATELAAGNGVCTASGLATLYGSLVEGRTPDGQQYLSPHTVKAIRRIRSYKVDRTLFYIPMMWHLGYHSLPTAGARGGFGHIGLGGSFGWVEPRLGLSVGFVHNRLTLPQMGLDQMSAMWLLPLTMNCLRASKRVAVEPPREAAA
ncbi:serine hydrolase domain-containing protein [Nocardia sp. XZ_19_385]|uniref:serine hydrolase domain-containing protein n=1 Tax=Nocardia sp. XZ_19_385 TaxID=2769488 RepID=UPI00188E9133|nr:serine hydrolase domain-containing protein [Nocardia sp. XZ_19_385]